MRWKSRIGNEELNGAGETGTVGGVERQLVEQAESGGGRKGRWKGIDERPGPRGGAWQEMGRMEQGEGTCRRTVGRFGRRQTLEPG